MLGSLQYVCTAVLLASVSPRWRITFSSAVNHLHLLFFLSISQRRLRTN